MRTGVIVAGGRSRRFEGRDKALAEVAGEPIVRRVADRVGEVVDELVVNCRAEQVAPLRNALCETQHDPRFAIDDVPDRGPVAGMAAGLRTASAPVAIVTACDMPALDTNFLDSLFDDARGHAGAVPTFGGHKQPLCAVYCADLTISACHAALSSDSDGFTGVLNRLDPVVVPETEVRRRTDAATFRNANTRSELRAIEDAVGNDANGQQSESRNAE